MPNLSFSNGSILFFSLKRNWKIDYYEKNDIQNLRVKLKTKKTHKLKKYVYGKYKNNIEKVRKGFCKCIYTYKHEEITYMQKRTRDEEDR